MLRKTLRLLLPLILIFGISHAKINTYTHPVQPSLGGDQSQDDERVEAIPKDDDRDVRFNLNLADDYYNRGNDYISSGQYARAIKDYGQALMLNPNMADAYYNRGNAYTYLGKHQRAMVDYSQVIRLNPNNSRAYNNRGLIYFTLRQFEQACSDFQKACKLGNCKALSWSKEKGVCQ